MATQMYCLECGAPVKYEADMAAPGIGYSYQCTKCETNFYSPDKEMLYSWDELDVDDFILDPDDCI